MYKLQGRLSGGHQMAAPVRLLFSNQMKETKARNCLRGRKCGLRIALIVCLFVIEMQIGTFSLAIEGERRDFRLNVGAGTAFGGRPEPPLLKPHRFFDSKNVGLFAGTGAIRLLDYTSTQYFRRRGLDEAFLTNGIVDNKPLFVAIEASGTAASIGFSYLFHKTGHHRMERWFSIVHIGVGTFGFIRNYNIAKGMPVIRR
jgi:hypothetical protein